MALNPYAQFLNGADPVAVARATPSALEALLAKIGDAGMGRPFAEGKWNASQIVCHLADVEISFGMRLRQTIAQPHHVIQPFEQDDWAKPYAQLDAKVALASFLALRAWNLAFVDTVAETEYGKPVTHPERGTMTFLGLLETMAGHDLNHLSQLETISGA